MTEPHTTKLFIEAVSFGETYLVGETEHLADEDMILMHIPTSETDAVVMAIDVPTAQKIATDVAVACGRLINKRVDDTGRKLHLGARLAALAERPSPLPPSAPEDLFKEPGLIEDANASRQGQAWIDERLRQDLACPECAGPVFIAAGPRAACADPDCKFANGIFPFPRQFRPAVAVAEHTHSRPGLTYGCPACSEVVKTLGNPVPSEHFVVEEESITRVPFNAEADTDGDAQPAKKLRHNHRGRDLKKDGSCPFCADHIDRHGIPEEEQ